jgi:hypothetical protein
MATFVGKTIASWDSTDYFARDFYGDYLYYTRAVITFTDGESVTIMATDVPDSLYEHEHAGTCEECSLPLYEHDGRLFDAGDDDTCTNDGPHVIED